MLPKIYKNLIFYSFWVFGVGDKLLATDSGHADREL